MLNLSVRQKHSPDSYVYSPSPSTPSASTDLAEDEKAKSRLFVENIENIISSHTSESRFQYPSVASQIPD